MSEKCIAETLKGKICKNSAYKDGKLCYLHTMMLLRERSIANQESRDQGMTEQFKLNHGG